MTNLLKIGTLLLTIAALFAAVDPSETAFDTLKGFQGRWAIQSDGKTLPIQMTYEIDSKGSIVTEHFGKELSVFYRNGTNLDTIHFCNAGNQPRLRMKESSPPGQLIFEMFDITSLKSAEAAHVERIVYRIIDEKRIELEIVWRKGNSQQPEKYILTRV
jgi:hypothetical protein